MRTPIDMAAELAAWITEQGHSATPAPLPDDFASSLPITLITSLGGSRTWPVIDTHRVQVETYADHMADAMDEARGVFAVIDSINDAYPIIGGVQTCGAETGGLPAESSDPNQPTFSVAAFVVQIRARTQEI